MWLENGLPSVGHLKGSVFGVAGHEGVPLYLKPLRGVAQPGSALAWGARGRGFESRRPDNHN